jgi:hypothetical protein
MNIVSFPGARTPSNHPEQPSVGLYLISALRRIGEPATLSELSDVVRQASGGRADWTRAFLGSVLERLSLTGLDELPGNPVFRPVILDSGAAWALTQDFRTILRSQDMPTALRPVLPPALYEDNL